MEVFFATCVVGEHAEHIITIPSGRRHDVHDQLLFFSDDHADNVIELELVVLSCEPT